MSAWPGVNPMSAVTVVLMTAAAHVALTQMRPVSRLCASRVHTVLERAEWLPLAKAHAAEVALALGTNDRFEYDRTDPVRNFFFEYYHFKPARLSMWCPGPGIAVRGATDEDFGTVLPQARFGSVLVRNGRDSEAVVFEAEAAPDGRRTTMAGALAVLRATAGREPHLLCHGMHEWAMLYYPEGALAAGVPPPERHQRSLSLRVSQAELNACVEAVPLRCTHFDAFRFFTEPARPLNREGLLSRELQVATEQPGCVHAAMDLFKWTIKALPYVEAALVPDTLRLALKARVLDMRASPYDLSAWEPRAAAGLRADASGGEDSHGTMGCYTRTRDGRPLPPLSSSHLAPIRVETSEGREEYRAYQRALYEEGVPVRERLIAQYELCLGLSPGEGAGSSSQ